MHLAGFSSSCEQKRTKAGTEAWSPLPCVQFVERALQFLKLLSCLAQLTL
jgi:hypothetical protein